MSAPTAERTATDHDPANPDRSIHKTQFSAV